MTYIVITGGQNYNLGRKHFYTTIERILQLNNAKNDILFITGDVRNSAETLSADYAAEHNYDYKIFQADWNTYGTNAGYNRYYNILNFIEKNMQPDDTVLYMIYCSENNEACISHAIDYLSFNTITRGIYDYNKMLDKYKKNKDPKVPIIKMYMLDYHADTATLIYTTVDDDKLQKPEILT